MMSALGLVGLPPLMERTSGRSDVCVGLIDGPVAANQDGLAVDRIRAVSDAVPGTCADAAAGPACIHGTFVVGILAARRNSAVPGICPDCTFLVRPIFEDTRPGNEELPDASPEDLAAAVLETVEAGARIINVSAAFAGQSWGNHTGLTAALDYAAARDVAVVAAAGNQGTLASSVITRHPWVIPVVSYDLLGRPMDQSNQAGSIGRRGLGGPGLGVTSVGTARGRRTLTGTSVAAPFVSGAIALLTSEFPTASLAEIRLALVHNGSRRRATVVPPLLDAWAAYQVMRR
jgi:subtilisin family serine protease